MKLHKRFRQAEWMDRPGLSPELHHQALAGLRRINAWSRTAAQIWAEIERISLARHLTHVRILDVACGGGDLARALAMRGARSNLIVSVEGCDVNPNAVEIANNSAAQTSKLPLRFFQHDALGKSLPQGFDFIVTTLFLHHLSDCEAVQLLQNMASHTEQAVLVDDLIRGRCGYWLAWAGCRLLSRSPVVHYDGPISVAAAFQVSEAHKLCIHAGLVDVEIRTHWPERFLLTWQKPPQHQATE